MDDMKKAARLKALDAVIAQMDEDEMNERFPAEESVETDEEAMEAEGSGDGLSKLSPEEIERLRALIA